MSEYGNTLDPVSQLVVGMERRRVAQLPLHPQQGITSSVSGGSTGSERDSPDLLSSSAATPVLILMTDQFGVCHAPYAQARSILTEHNYGSVLCVVHDTFGQIATYAASALVPPTPDGDAPLTHEEFLKIDVD